jgi:hypothetical protein
MRRYLTAIFMMYGLTSAALAQEATATGPYSSEEQYLEDRRTSTARIPYDAVIGLISAVELRTHDQVEDGCWTNVSAVSARVRAELERAEVPVYQEPLSSNWLLTPVLELSALGYRTPSGHCLGTISIKLRYTANYEMGSLAFTQKIYSIPLWAVMWENRYLVSGGQSLNSQFLEVAQEFADLLTADIIQARREPAIAPMRDQWRDHAPMTQSAFDEMIARWEDAL